MFGLELWFVFAVLSAFFAGVESFVHKVAAASNYSVALLNVYGTALATFILTILVLATSDFSSAYSVAALYSGLAAFVYFGTLLLKVESLRLIDATVFFPIYKVVGPLIVIFAGIAFFGESFTTTEWVGLVLSLMVPLLLVSKMENSRQKNLAKGLGFLLLAALVAMVSVSFHKLGVNNSPDIVPLMWVTTLVALCTSILYVKVRNKDSLQELIIKQTDKRMLIAGFSLGLLSLGTVYALYSSFANGGPLGIVYTISSAYILITIILSIIFYKEHWNARKVLAIVLSVAALALLQ